MPYDRPIWFAAAAGDGFVWANCFSASCIQRHSMGPLHFLQQLPMDS